MPRLAVILTVHNRRETTLRCLRDWEKCPRPEGWTADIWLTDDGSTDGTAEAVAAEFPQVHIIAGDGTLFWCRGMLAAWEAADRAGEYDAFLWLNDDTYLYPEAVLRLEEASGRHPDSILIGPVCSGVTGLQTYGGRDRKERHPAPAGEDLTVYTFDGNIVWVPASVRQRLGLLDGRFSHAMGDMEYGYRASRAGVAIWQLGEFLGTCEQHDRRPAWCDPAVPLRTRWQKLHSPLGLPPSQFFYVARKGRGWFYAARCWVSIHFRTLFPWLWGKNK